MSENQEQSELELESPEPEQSQEYSEIEMQAMEHGWNPEGAEGKRNLTAEEFMDRQPLYDDIRSLKKQTRKLQEGIEAMKAMQEGIRQREREKTIKELQAQKKQALETEDYDTVVDIDDRIAAERANTGQTPNVAFEQWVDSNEWYHQDDDMREYADMIGAGYYSKNPARPVEEVYKYVTKEVKARFPEKFGDNPKRSQPTPVEGANKGRAGRSTSAKYSAKDLPEQDRRIMETIVRSGTMTKDEYLKSYFGE